MTAETFSKWGNAQREKVMDKYEIEHKVCIVPSPFRAMRYIDDASYLPGATTLESEKLKETAKNDVYFSKSRSPLSSNSFSTFRILSL